ncbi:MAG: permease [Patescibacteria group bacterium]
MNQSLYNRLYDFLMIVLGLLVESMPFVVIGVLISALLGSFVKGGFFLKYKSKNPILSHIQSMLIGLFLPVCECGNVPLAKRLSLIGFKPSEVITFMLAAPILNPLVLITTLEAFNMDRNIAFIRIGAGALIALVVGLIFSTHPAQDELLMPFNKNLRSMDSFSKAIEETDIESKTSHTSEFFETFRVEFFSVFRVLLLGCVLAGIFQTIIPREFIQFFAGEPTLSIVALMILAFIISICSSVDAFFALSLASTFSLGSILSFLVFGPMIDIKTLTMLRSIFKLKTLLLMTAIVATLCLMFGMGVNNFYKLFY